MVATIDPRLGVVRAIGLALLLAGLLAVDRSREDVVTWTVQGVTGITFAVVFASLFSETIGPESDENNVAALAYIGVALWGLRIFRGAFRRRRDEHDISSYG